MTAGHPGACTWSWPHFGNGWSQADALRGTTRLTQQMFDVHFPQALYANYVFYAVWLADVVVEGGCPTTTIRPASTTWLLRGFYMLILFNAAVVFAMGWRRILGLLIVSWLARTWSRGMQPTALIPTRAPDARAPRHAADQVVVSPGVTSAEALRRGRRRVRDDDRNPSYWGNRRRRRWPTWSCCRQRSVGWRAPGGRCEGAP